MIREIIKEYNLNKKLNPDTIEELYKPANQISLIDFLNTEPNREFALYILNDAIVKRENTDVSFDLEDLIFASFLLAIHKNPEDSLLIWEAKEVDFDTHCGHDIQLVVGGGVNETISFLKELDNKNAKDALEYIKDCDKTGDFNDIENYFKGRPCLL